MRAVEHEAFDSKCYRWTLWTTTSNGSPGLQQFVETKVFRERREVHTKFKLVPSKYQRAHQAALFNPPFVPKLDNRNVGEPPTRP
jgi:hypothetical protein